ncbi:MAG: M14 family metallopeptidase [Gammaproteobacteria bacterium]|jgi:predicted deacylase
MSRADFEFAGQRIAPGSRATCEIPLAGLYTHTPVYMPAQIVHGRRDGPVAFVSAAVHGDEIKGAEIIRRLLRMPLLRRLHGTLIAVPIVNVFGFHNRSRYLPDRRDLNRSFPGSDTGSLAARLAHVFLHEVAARADLGIDLHTAAIHRENLPQIRADLNDPILVRLADAFGAPVTLHSASPEGSLRSAAARIGVPVMVYEAGEALRFDEASIRIGLRGVLNVLRMLRMIPAVKTRPPRPAAVLRSSTWVRADQSGIVRTLVKVGGAVETGDTLALIADPFGEKEDSVLAPTAGVIIGRVTVPLVYEGEALFHIGKTRRAESVGEQFEAAQADLENPAPELIEEPPIV